MKVLVFKTSVGSPQEVRTVEPLLNKLLNKTEKWNFDLDDCDHILRVEAEFVEAHRIVAGLEEIGIVCAELE